MAELRFPSPVLSDAVVALRPWTLDDLGFVVDACQDAELSRFSPAIPSPYGERDARAWFESQTPARVAGEELNLAVVDATSGRLLGAIGLIKVSETAMSAEVGYWLAREARGHGHISRAVRLLARWAFDELGLARLELTTDPENVASQRVAERCGFRQEGHLRSHVLIRHSGQRRDTLVYGLLPGDLLQQGA